jgi:hypothetical protein
VSAVFTAEGWKALRASWAILAASLAAGAALVYGTHWYGLKEKRDSLEAGHRLQEARARLDNARRERDNLEASAGMFRTLVERGLLEREHRLDLVEKVNALRERHRLYTLDYEIAPQRPLPLAGGRVYPSVDVLASRVQLHAKALHEGDVLAFIDELSRSRQGFYPVDRCTLRRIAGPPGTLAAHVEADCTLEWITLRDKEGHHG